MNSTDMPEAETLVGWLLEHADLQIVESDTDSESSYEDLDVYSDTDSVSDYSDEYEGAYGESNVSLYFYFFTRCFCCI